MTEEPPHSDPSDDTVERLIALQLTPHLGEKTLRALAAAGDARARAAFDASEEALRDDYDFHPEAASVFFRRRLKLLDDARLLLVSLRRADADALHPGDARYPSRLRGWTEAPPLLYARGDFDLLNAAAVCFLASASATSATVARLRACADRVARAEYAIVTGHNRDVYQSAALAAAEHASPVMYVLDRGLFGVAGQGRSAPFAAGSIHPSNGQRRLFLSPFRPKDPFIGHNNRRRDRLVAALASLVVAVEIRPGGVMERECLDALRRGQRVVALAPEGRLPETHSRLYDAGALLIQSEEELIRHLWDAGIAPPA